MIVISEIISTEHNNSVSILTSHIKVSEHLQFRKTDEQEFFEKKMRGWGVIRENFEKYRGTFLLFHS